MGSHCMDEGRKISAQKILFIVVAVKNYRFEISVFHEGLDLIMLPEKRGKIRI